MSAIERETIRGTAYAVTRLDPLRGGRLAVKVGGILAAALADQGAIEQIVNAYRDSQKTPDVAPAALDGLLGQPQLLAALAGGVHKLDTDALYDAAMDFARGKLFAGDRKLHDDAAFNAHFTEHPDHLMLVLAWVLRVNCAGFFGLGGRA